MDQQISSDSRLLKVNTVRWTAKQSEEAHIECHGVTPGVWLKAIGSQVGAFPVCHVLGGKKIKMKKKNILVWRTRVLGVWLAGRFSSFAYK